MWRGFCVSPTYCIIIALCALNKINDTTGFTGGSSTKFKNVASVVALHCGSSFDVFAGQTTFDSTRGGSGTR